MRVRIAVAAAVAFALASTTLVSAAGTLDYDFFKAKVQPIFLEKRPGHAPCVMCHADANNMLHLEKLPDGQSTWTEEQTRKNFDTVSKIVQAADDPLTVEDPAASAGAGSRRRRLPFRRPAIRQQERSGLEDIAAWAQGATLAPARSSNSSLVIIREVRTIAVSSTGRSDIGYRRASSARRADEPSRARQGDGSYCAAACLLGARLCRVAAARPGSPAYCCASALRRPGSP